MSETSDHLKILIEKPYLRPYFYDNKAWVEGDVASLDEVKAMAELMLDNFASAIIHSAVSGISGSKQQICASSFFYKPRRYRGAARGRIVTQCPRGLRGTAGWINLTIPAQEY